MIAYWNDYHQRLLVALFEHMKLVFLSILIALLFSMILVIVSLNNDRWLRYLVYFFSVLYSVPSYAFFAILIPISGLGFSTAVIVLTLYCEYILLRTFITGIKQIDSVIVEAGTAMGMTEKQLFFKIQLPLATQSIFSGIRLALTSIIGIATIAATINAGGLGTILFDGLRTQNIVKIVWGSLLTILLCLFCNMILRYIEKISLKRIRGGTFNESN